jgi:recombinational DNA repair ATPase RecF
MAGVTRLTITGFKSIRELRDFELRNLNVLIGANGAGKSNFIGLFRMRPLIAARAAVDNPEGINDSPQTAPSKRLEQLRPHYRKTFHGPKAAARIGLDKIREQCPHFSQMVRPHCRPSCRPRAAPKH